MLRTFRIIVRWLVVVVYGGLIFCVSALSAPIGPGWEFRLPYGLDKVIHFLEYAVFCFLLCRAVDITRGGDFSRPIGKKALWVCFLLVVLFAVTDEVHQLYVPFRTCSGYDFLADAAGAAAVALLWPVATAWMPFLRE